MHRRLFLLFSLVTLLALAPTTASALSVGQVPNPRRHGGWVSDTANVISPSDESRLNQMIDGIEREQGVEIAVVTAQSVDTATPKDFATKLFNTWHIGKKESNNGLLVLLVVGQHRVEMETGYGTEAVLTDGWLKHMQMQQMIPYFKQNQYGKGLVAGVSASISRLRKYRNGIPENDASYGVSSGGDDLDVAWAWIFFGSILLLIVGLIAWRWKWVKDRTCEECGERMQMLPEEEDDVHLDEGQQTEEAIGSVDYQFWYCADCGTSRLLRVGKWFSGYKKCPSCGYKTRTVQTNTISYPTYSSTGLQEIIEDCANCDFHRRRTRVLPRKTRSSSSSSFGGSSGGGSFGGGSSGGGGAGSSW